ncbi:hypothetical protein [Pelagibacterium luteolum]|uniref:Uncharacterized protein n=1 Tax=Pelagibacterium luteolum TaxID=440168 RepID=A0A1G7WIR9_9HYPH|nr:hypothetical protein [Pelagibacterium luteolum]SDG71891.1 hypothetical protein SAMN04487974_106197 [Pelagibacterium luteolum]
METAPATLIEPLGSECLDFTGLAEADAIEVRKAIARGENFHGYIPTESLGFIIRNYRVLAALGGLEAPWLDAYVHASHFRDQGVSVLKDVFDACDRDRLRALKPLGETFTFVRGERLTLFRGCAGPVHSMGMSWTPSLDKAIWYAAHHVEYYDLPNPAVYVSTVSVAEIYCRLDHYDDDFIVHPCESWRVDVPANEYRLNRPR